MGRIARSEAAKPISGALSRYAVSRVSRRAPRDANALAACLWVREWIRYARELPETFATLAALHRLPVGDCDDMAIALSALLWRLGYRWDDQRWAVGWHDSTPAHVWVEARGQGGQWIPLDPSTYRLGAGSDPRTIGRFSRTTTHAIGGTR